jgi:hypothetical protein
MAQLNFSLAFRDAAPTKLVNKQFIIPFFLYGVQKARCMIDTEASISFTSQQVVDKHVCLLKMKNSNFPKAAILNSDTSTCMALLTHHYNG